MKIGLSGIGHLGKSHLKCLLQTPFAVVGIHDINVEKGRKVAEEFGIPFYENYLQLLEDVDVIDIVTTTRAHYELAQTALMHDKHIFIEKPVTSNVHEAEKLIELHKQRSDSIIQVGHIERYNPGLTVIQEYIGEPRFIETHRLAPLQSRGLDISVIKDLMIHDLDLILYWVKHPVKNIYANGVALLNDSPDICNARIEFENGTVCNITASRVSMKQMRKSRIFQGNGYISIDFMKPEGQYIQFSRNPDDEFIIEVPKVPKRNALLDELVDFHRCITGNINPLSNLASAYKALSLANEIELIVKKNNT